MEGKTRCEVCEKIIPKERLRALPFTTTCVRCSQVVGYTEDTADLDCADGSDMLHMVQNTRRND